MMVIWVILGILVAAALFVVGLDISHPAKDHSEPPSQMDEWDR